MGIAEGELQRCLGEGEVRVGRNREESGDAGKELEENQQEDAGKGVEEECEEGGRRVGAGSRLAGKEDPQRKGDEGDEHQGNQVEQHRIPDAGAQKEAYRGAGDEAGSQVPMENHPLQPLEVLDIEGLVQPEFLSQPLHLHFGEGPLLGAAASLEAARSFSLGA